MITNMKIWIRGPHPDCSDNLDAKLDAMGANLDDKGLFEALQLGGGEGDIIANANAQLEFIRNERGDCDMVYDVKNYTSTRYGVPPLLMLQDVSKVLGAQLICTYDVPELGLAGLMKCDHGALICNHVTGMD